MQPDGWFSGVRRVCSPNCDRRPPGVQTDLLIIHGISLPPGEFGGTHVDRLFTNTLEPHAHPSFCELAALRVSTHLLIRRDGALTQYVSLHRRAWHAGESEFRGRRNCNDFSIGIELEGQDDVAYEDEQYRQLAVLSALLLRCVPGLRRDRIVGHCDVSPGRKTDPGPAFDWQRYHRLLDRHSDPEAQ